MWHLAVGLGVVVGASVVAHFFNEKTNEERARQDRAYRERDNIYSRYHSDREQSEQDFNRQRKAQASEYKSLLLKEIEEHLKKVSPITKAYQELYDAILKEINSETTSPYRKSALSKEFTRIEDAQIRIAEYDKYLNFEKGKISELWEKGNYGWLLERPIADALLPLEWLYPGKLLMVELSDMDKPLDNSRHILKFAGFNGEPEQQKALALKYGDEFPILIIKNNRNSFYGCVSRGIAFHDHIRMYEPITMLVERYRPNNQDYLCNYSDGILKATLPQQALLQPGMRCIPGQNVEVYFDSFDATLQFDPKGTPLKNKRKPFPTISEKKPATIGLDEFEIFVEVNDRLLEKVPSDSSFYDENTEWSLIDFEIDSGVLTLVKGNVEVRCNISDKNDGLMVTKISVHQTPQVGIDLPFKFILLSTEFKASELFGWVYGVEQLISFANQALINSTSANERLEQLEFFKRWERVVEYQKQQESTRKVEFEMIPSKNPDNSYHLSIDLDVIDSSKVNERTVSSFLKEVEDSDYLNTNRSCRLLVWDYDSGKFIPAVGQSRLNQTKIELSDKGNIEISAYLNNYRKIDYSESQKFQLEVNLPNVPLQRQRIALETLFEDRMVEPRLKEIFLSPSSYLIEKYAYWNDYDINWSKKLTISQERAVKTALSAKHIAMIQGPPGTGKTTTIVEMLYQILQKNRNQKILIVSQQNTAVDNAITKFKKEFPELLDLGVNIVRVGNPAKIDDDMAEDHFESVFDSFVKKCINSSTEKYSSLNGQKSEALIEWRALMQQLATTTSTNKISDEFFTTMLADKNLIGATCVGLASRQAGIDHLTFDIAIVDEAGRATVPELLIPLLRSKKVILIGDHHQLPPSVAPILREDEAKEEMQFLEETFLETSFFETLFEQLPKECTATLSEQFRMSDPIGNLVAELFYTTDGIRKLENGSDKPTDTTDFVDKDCIAWFDVWGKQRKPAGSTSIENQMEAEAICDYLKKVSIETSRKIDVAVITPYGAQKRLIRKLLHFKHGSQQVNLKNLTIKVDTVDSFQGSEAELVCYSTVRTFGSLSFLLDKKRLNVACSRAKENLIFFGNIRALEGWKPKGDEQNLFKRIIQKARIRKYIPKNRKSTHQKSNKTKNMNNF